MIRLLVLIHKQNRGLILKGIARCFKNQCLTLHLNLLLMEKGAQFLRQKLRTRFQPYKNGRRRAGELRCQMVQIHIRIH
jgi:hypothetical protein